MLDKFARTQGIPFPGGPKIGNLSQVWEKNNATASLDEIVLPYGVQGLSLIHI